MKSEAIVYKEALQQIVDVGFSSNPKDYTKCPSFARKALVDGENAKKFHDNQSAIAKFEARAKRWDLIKLLNKLQDSELPKYNEITDVKDYTKIVWTDEKCVDLILLDNRIIVRGEDFKTDFKTIEFAISKLKDIFKSND